jgi:hypothetical protein
MCYMSPKNERRCLNAGCREHVGGGLEYCSLFCAREARRRFDEWLERRAAAIREGRPNDPCVPARFYSEHIHETCLPQEPPK